MTGTSFSLRCFAGPMPESIRSLGEPMAPAVTITSLAASRRSSCPPFDDFDANGAALLDEKASDEEIGLAP